jgi:hypothetical protein
MRLAAGRRITRCALGDPALIFQACFPFNKPVAQLDAGFTLIAGARDRNHIYDLDGHRGTPGSA